MAMATATATTAMVAARLLVLLVVLVVVAACRRRHACVHMLMCMPSHVEMLCAACPGLPHSHALPFRLRAGVRAQACRCAVAHASIKGVPSGHSSHT